jgi:putative ABC transport system permease protein
MLKHNLLLFYRNFRRFRSTFLINLAGLSMGLTCSLLIYLWVRDERSIDRFHEKDDRLFMVMHNHHETTGIRTGLGTPGPLAKSLAEEMPEVAYAVAVVPPELNDHHGVISIAGKRIKVKAQFAGRDFFHVFTYKLLEGDKDRVLADKSGVAISEDLALKIFNTTEDVVGKTIAWGEGEKNELYFISGLFKSPPANASNQFDLVFCYELFLKGKPWLETWTSTDPRTYVVLKDGVSADQFSNKIKGFVKAKDKDSNGTLLIQRYSDHYLYGQFENGIQAGGRIAYVRLFTTIAVFILVIACINFMNLSTAKASRRIREVGIKKAIGAGRKSLILQYLGESMAMAFLSLCIAILMTDLLLAPFNTITGKTLSFAFDSRLIFITLSITFVTGLLAGSYPALYLSGFSPVVVLKGRLNAATGEIWARKGLVVFQFAIAVILIVAVIVVYRQMEYIQTKNLGYERDHVVYFDTEKVSTALMAEIKALPGVVNAARFYHDLTGNHGGTYALTWEGKKPDELIDFENLEVGYDLIETLGFEMAEGKSFSEDFGSAEQVIFNEAAIRAMGLQDPVGKTVNIWNHKRQIVGVVRNFHFESLYEEIKPCFLFLVPMHENTPSKLMVKIQAGTEKATLDRLQQLHQRYNPGLPFEFNFLDDDYQRLYASEQRVSALSRYFAGAAILISCLGLFGLAAFTAERRLKEIGIRKVLGSSTRGIVYLLSGDFTKIVFIAILIALPASYQITTQWLNAFAFRIALEWWYFAGAGVAALLIAWLTVGTQALKAARVNPVKCLKDE